MIEIISAAQDQQPVIANLIELYAHDFSEFLHLGIGDDGRFGYPLLPLYWTESGRHPILIRVDGKLAGFALVKKGSEGTGSEDVWDMAEFFILRGYRKEGIGTRAAHEIWSHFPGPWEVRVMQANVAGQHFWASAIAMFVGEAVETTVIEKRGELWTLFGFVSSL